ncbi:MAG: 5-oxoprolinase subunit PxpB [SAR202 cluster bacterium]|jgi:KipI family sensor histidine kinase inhibitor|nr:allophanate hydrolase [Chloroflexota bacterium]MQF83447.1 5-oxoprolinase subunit PxpB [SAR202 cluster bacterium]MEC9099518.1 5-oxoprolinase subunit PxpB [Chloroflexota bacterium]MQG19748.1 5-oxoprolinase subunit PxpB [SAR202 cluster bacterium]MQG24069.1 5-oxoprolinase subunit PxpB [SAR202 cluster bacterium]|tara:strand:+ start:4414 stop:5082 length:669 start_codon:yes stop_codon:yes gene_type:complete
MKEFFQINFHGDSTLVIEFGKDIDVYTNKLVQFVFSKTEKRLYKNLFIKDVYPTYKSLVINYDNLAIDYQALKKKIEPLIFEIIDNYDKNVSNDKVLEIPVKYGGEFGPDLKIMSKKLNISEESIINIHSSAIYRIYMIGFMPGFPYLGGLDERISFPRLSTPRIKVPAGSVGIAGKQTGIYPFESPGGWNIIGRTELSLFDVDANPPSLLSNISQLRFLKL